jgi:transposase
MRLIRDLAREALAGRDQLAVLDKRITAVLDHHPDAALIRSLPGMGATLTAEFLAITGGITRYPSGDQLAAAAGLASRAVRAVPELDRQRSEIPLLHARSSTTPRATRRRLRC